MTQTTDERFEQFDRQLRQLERRMRRVEGELGITEVDDAGVPAKGERFEQPAEPNHH